MKYRLRTLLIILTVACVGITVWLRASKQADIRHRLLEHDVIAWTAADLEEYACDPYEFEDVLFERSDNSWNPRLSDLHSPVVFLRIGQCRSDERILEWAGEFPELRAIELCNTLLPKKALQAFVIENPKCYVRGYNLRTSVEFNLHFRGNFPSQLEY